MAQQPVVEMLLTTEVKSLQVKLNPHQEHLPDSNSKTPKKEINCTSPKNTSEKEIFQIFFGPKYGGLGTKVTDGKAEGLSIS